MVAEATALIVFVLAVAAERLHARRVRRVAPLAFGPHRRPAAWTFAAPPLRVTALAALTWGLLTLLQVQPKVHKTNFIPENEFRQLLLVLDVSPSMRLQDAGPTGKQSRAQRAADLLKSFFERTPVERFRTTIVATYTGAKPVVVNSTDLEVVRNVLTELPMQFAFRAGPTDIFAGLEEAAKIAQPWRPRSTTLMVISDGDTIPATGMPKLPPSIDHVVVAGVGDVKAGKFIAGHQSRQDASTLRQLAARLGGTYHDGNEKHLSSELVRRVTAAQGKSALEKLTRREYALIAVALGTSVLGLLPFALYWAGTCWTPGVPRDRAVAAARQKGSRSTVPAVTMTATAPPQRR